MSGSTPYEIYRSEKFFDTGHKRILKYLKKVRKSDEAYKVKLSDFLEKLKLDPNNIPESTPEPWPKGAAANYPEHTFHKIRFQVPGLSGAKEHARLMYAKKDGEGGDAGEIRIAILYTHGDHDPRPPDKTIKQAMEDAMSDD